LKLSQGNQSRLNISTRNIFLSGAEKFFCDLSKLEIDIIFLTSRLLVIVRGVFRRDKKKKSIITFGLLAHLSDNEPYCMIHSIIFFKCVIAPWLQRYRHTIIATITLA
jgi:hypothetical protein